MRTESAAAQESLGNFAEFWSRFPRRVGKLAAEKAYAAALRKASHEEIMAGVERYIRTKPAYADWCHAKTWLNQGRWLDEPDGVPAPGGLFKTEPEPWICRHEPRCPHRTACWVVSQRKVSA